MVIDVIENGIEQRPEVDVAALTDYSQMKDKLVMEVVSAEFNAEMLENVPHQNMEDMAVVYRFVLDSNEDGRLLRIMERRSGMQLQRQLFLRLRCFILLI